MEDAVIAIDDPRAPDVRALLDRHLAFAHETTPIEDVHALAVDALVDPAVTFFSARLDGQVSLSARSSTSTTSTPKCSRTTSPHSVSGSSTFAPRVRDDHAGARASRSMA